MVNARESELAAEVAKRPTDFAPYQQLARIYSMTGRRDEAEQVLRQALAVHADSGAVFAALISLHSKPQDPHRLLAVADEWTRAEPTNHQPLLVASRAHQELAAAAKSNPAEARMHAEQANHAFEEATRLKGLQDAAAPPRPIAQGGQLRAATPVAGFPNAVRAGGNVRVPRKIKDVKPVTPPAALEQRVQGVVILEIVINETGGVADAKVLRSIPLLDQAALDAVKEWQFEPTELEGRPVPVIITVTVQFMNAP
ncbi:MAG: TonB family protein [Planctomycetota bacterium]|nr:TonB family protein [Planctomycetota bacterium]